MKKCVNASGKRQFSSPPHRKAQGMVSHKNTGFLQTGSRFNLRKMISVQIAVCPSPLEAFHITSYPARLTAYRAT